MKKRCNTPGLKCVHLLRGMYCLLSIYDMLLKDFFTWKFVVNTIIIIGPCVVQF